MQHLPIIITMPYKAPDPNHFFEGRDLDTDEKAFHKAINIQHDVEYSTLELMKIVEVFEQYPATTEVEIEIKEKMIEKTKQFMSEILYKQRNKRRERATLNKLDRMD